MSWLKTEEDVENVDMTVPSCPRLDEIYVEGFTVIVSSNYPEDERDLLKDQLYLFTTSGNCLEERTRLCELYLEYLMFTCKNNNRAILL